MESFKKMIPQEASVKREGKTYNVPASQLVIGDIVSVKIGDKVPADIRIVSIDILF
jgi:P-type E1-E2 ATPase